MYEAEDWLSDIMPLYKNIVPVSNVCIPKPPTLSRSALRLNIGKLCNDTERTPILNIVSNTMVQQKASPKQISNKQVQNLSKSQHRKLYERFPHLRDKQSLPVVTISEDNQTGGSISVPVLLNILPQ